MQSSRYNNLEYGSVFKQGINGGPRLSDLIHGGSNVPGGIQRRGATQLPGWPDKRYPGNANVTESSGEIMKQWDNQQMKRFQIFMDQFYLGATPWKLEYLDRTAPDYKKQEYDILKCKMELIKRLLHIKVVGCESMEDWCLLFLYYDNQLSLPPNIEELVRPGVSKLTLSEYASTKYRTKRVMSDQVTIAPDLTLEYMSNPIMPGFGTPYFNNPAHPIPDNQKVRVGIPEAGFDYYDRAANPRGLDADRLIFPQGTERAPVPGRSTTIVPRT